MNTRDAVEVNQVDVTFANHIIAGFRQIAKNEWFADATARHWLAKDIARHRLAHFAGVGEDVRDALRQCGERFAFYAREHTAAGKHEKAATNQWFADLATNALASTPPATDAGLREAFERMIRKPYAKNFEAVPWHVLERSETDARFYRHADTRSRWEDFHAGARAAVEPAK